MGPRTSPYSALILKSDYIQMPGQINAPEHLKTV